MILTEAQRESVNDWFLNAMVALFAPPFHLKATEPIRLALEQYTEALARFTGVELQAGWSRVREEHKTKNWPVLADCVKACQGARQGARAAKKHVEEQALVKVSLDELMRSDVGQDAIKAGQAQYLEAAWRGAGASWPEDLDRFRRREPAEKCMAVSMATLADWPDCKDKTDLQSMGRRMQERETKLAERYG